MTAIAQPRVAGARLWCLLLVLSGTMLLDAVEVSVALVALPSIRGQLGFSTAALHWVVSGFALGFGGLVLLGRRLVDRFGSRQVYLAGLLCFAAVSLLGAVAPTPLFLVVTRLLKGCCVALTAPTGLAIIGATFADGTPRHRAVAVYSLFGAGGFTTGLVLSGLLTTVSWRLTFLFPVPVALVLFAAALWLVPRDEIAPSGPLDTSGAATLVGAVGLFMLACTAAARWGWADPRVTAALLLAVASLVLFVRVERAAERPIIRLGVLRREPLVRSMVGAATCNGTNWGFLYVVTLHLQDVARWSPLRAGLAMVVPASLLLALAAPLSGGLVGRFGAARLIAIGALGPPIGYALYLRAPTVPVYVTDVMPSMAFVGFGFALGCAALHVQAVSGVPGDEQAMVAGVYQTAAQIGGAVVLAVVAAVLATSGQHAALLLLTAIGGVGLLVALAGLRPTPDRRAAG